MSSPGGRGPGFPVHSRNIPDFDSREVENLGFPLQAEGIINPWRRISSPWGADVQPREGGENLALSWGREREGETRSCSHVSQDPEGVGRLLMKRIIMESFFSYLAILFIVFRCFFLNALGV